MEGPKLGLKVTLPFTDGKLRHAGRSARVEVIHVDSGDVVGMLAANDLRILTPLDGVVMAQVRVPYVEIVVADPEPPEDAQRVTYP